MRDALVFNGASNLDFQDVRSNVIRIPEVVSRIREAQKIWDSVAPGPLDLANMIASDDSVFLGNIRLKSFATAVVQLGLMDRLLKRQALPEFLIGVVNGDSALKVAAGLTTFLDLVAESPAAGGGGLTPNHAVSPGDVPILSGVQIAEFGVFRRQGNGGYERLPSDARDVGAMIVNLVENHDVNRIVTVGPGQAVFSLRLMDLTGRDVQLAESIDLDPMLSWFWGHLRESRLAIAN